MARPIDCGFVNFGQSNFAVLEATRSCWNRVGSPAVRAAMDVSTSPSTTTCEPPTAKRRHAFGGSAPVANSAAETVAKAALGAPNWANAVAKSDAREKQAITA